MKRNDRVLEFSGGVSAAVLCVSLMLLSGVASAQPLAPTLEYFSPTGGPPGTPVIITGTGFDPAVPGDHAVTVNGYSAEVTRVLPTEIHIVIPVAATTGVVSVTAPGGVFAGTAPFVVSPLTVSVFPRRASLLVNQSKAFQALATGGATSEVVWAVNGIVGGNAAVGSITAGNPSAYTAPDIPPTPDTVLITASSAENPDVKAYARVRIFAPTLAVPDIEYIPADPATFSLDPEVGLPRGRTRILVMLERGAGFAPLAPVIALHEGEIVGSMPEIGLMAVEIPDSGGLAAAKNAADAFLAVPGVAVATPDALVEEEMVEPRPNEDIDYYVGGGKHTVPADFFWSWQVEPTGRNWGLEYIRMPVAWNWSDFVKKRPDPDILTAIVDGPAYVYHSDLVGRSEMLWKSYNAFYLGKGYCEHGTHVAGTIVCNWDNKRGITGVTPFATVISQPSVSVSAKAGIASLGDDMLGSFRQLLRDTAGRDIRVVNISQGYNWFSNQFIKWHDLNGDGVKHITEWVSAWNWNAYHDAAANQWVFELEDLSATPQHTPSQALMARAFGKIALEKAAWAGGQHPDSPHRIIITQSAGNNRKDIPARLAAMSDAKKRFVDHTHLTPGAEARRDTWNDDNFRSEHNGPFTWAAYHGATNILVVEALTEQSDREIILRTDFSNRAIDRDTGEPIAYAVSAPGQEIVSAHHDDPIGYTVMDGTSMAAPHAAGLLAYLFALDPELTIDQAMSVITSSGRTSAGAGGIPTAAPAIDGYRAALAIDQLPDRQPGGAKAHKRHLMRLALFNIDDGTVDGNDRLVEMDSFGTVHDEEGDGVESDDIVIDMSDFRRFRDAYLLVTGHGDHLNGPGSLKRDLNRDGVVETPEKENVYPRMDFDGDGIITAADLAKLTGHPDVAELWSDRDVTDEHVAGGLLQELLHSGDIKVDPKGCFKDGINKIKVFAKLVDTGEVRQIKIEPEDVLDEETGEDRRRIITLPADREFMLYARAYVDDDFKRFLLDPDAPPKGRVKEGEDKLTNLKSARLATLPASLIVDMQQAAAVALAFVFDDGKEVSYQDYQDSGYSVSWNYPTEYGMMAESETGYTFTSLTRPGNQRIGADIVFDGESIIPEGEEVYLDTTVRTAYVTSPGGLAVDPRGNFYVSDTVEGTVTMAPPGGKGLVLLRDLVKAADVEVDARGRSLIVAEADGRISRHIFGISGVVRDVSGRLLTGATATVESPIAIVPGIGDTASRPNTDEDGTFHVFGLLRPELPPSTPVTIVVTIEYQGKAQAYPLTLEASGQTVLDFEFNP